MKALVDGTARGRIRVTGEDRARLLHAMTTNHVQGLQPGEGLYAFFLNAQGRILADVYVLCFEDHLLLDTEPETREAVFEHLDRYIIADDATLEDVTEATFCLVVEGDSAVSGFRVAGNTRIYGPAEMKAETIGAVKAEGAILLSDEDAERRRIQLFRPRYGRDITAAMLPQETQQTHALHFQKGCYLGQEIVERVRSRGHVNRHLMGYRTAGNAAPAPGAKVMADGKEAGEVTSSITGFGLALIRVPHDKAGATVEIDGHPAELAAPYGLS